MTNAQKSLKKTLINLILCSCILSLLLVATSSQSAKLIKAIILTNFERSGISVPETDALQYKFPVSAFLKRASLKVGGNPLELSEVSLTPTVGLSGLGFSLNASAYGGEVYAQSINPSNDFTIGIFEIKNIEISRISPINALGITKGSLSATSKGGSIEKLPLDININNLTFSPPSLIEGSSKPADLVLESITFSGNIVRDQLSGMLSGKGPAGTINGDLSASLSNLQLKGELLLTDFGARTIGPYLALVGASNAGAGEAFSVSLRGTLQTPRLSVTRKTT